MFLFCWLNLTLFNFDQSLVYIAICITFFVIFGKKETCIKIFSERNMYTIAYLIQNVGQFLHGQVYQYIIVCQQAACYPFVYYSATILVHFFLYMTLSRYTFFMLHFLCVALFSYCIFFILYYFHPAPFYVVLFMLGFFLVAFFRVAPYFFCSVLL